MFDPPSRLECRTIGGPAAPNVVQACSAQAIASEASNLALLSTLTSRQGLRGRRDGWPRVRMGATLPWPAPHSHRLYQLAAARKYARELREIRAKEFALHFRAGPFPSLAEGPELPLANLRTAKTGPAFKRLSDKIRHVVDSSFPYDDSSVSAAINRKPWSRLQRALSQFWRNKLSPWVALPCSSNSTSSEPTNCCSYSSRSGIS